MLDKSIQKVSVPEKSFLDDGKIVKDPGLNWTNIACDNTFHWCQFLAIKSGGPLAAESKTQFILYVMPFAHLWYFWTCRKHSTT